MAKLKLDTTSEQNILNMLMDHSLIKSSDMEKVKKMSKEVGKSKLETAFELNFTDEEKILNLLSTSYSLPIVDLTKYKINDKLKKIVDPNYIRDNSLVPFEIDGETLKIAIPDASKLSLMKNLKTLTKKDPELFAASISDINAFIDKLTDGGRNQTSKIEQVKKKEKTVPLEVESKVVNFVEKTIGEAIDLGASDIHIESFRNTAKIRFSIDGILKTMDQYTKFLKEILL